MKSLMAGSCNTPVLIFTKRILPSMLQNNAYFWQREKLTTGEPMNSSHSSLLGLDTTAQVTLQSGPNGVVTALFVTTTCKSPVLLIAVPCNALAFPAFTIGALVKTSLCRLGTELEAMLSFTVSFLAKMAEDFTGGALVRRLSSCLLVEIHSKSARNPRQSVLTRCSRRSLKTSLIASLASLLAMCSHPWQHSSKSFAREFSSFGPPFSVRRKRLTNSVMNWSVPAFQCH